MTSAADQAHVKIGAYKFQLEESMEEHYVYEETTESIPQPVFGDTGKVDVDQDERLMWRMTDWRGGEGAKYFDVNDPSVYRYAENDPGSYTGTPATAAQWTKGSTANTRIKGQMTNRPVRGRPAVVTVTDATKKNYLAIADGQVWLGGSKELFYNDFDTNGSDAWTSKTSNVASGHSITAFGGSEDWVFYGTSDANSAALRATNVAYAGSTEVVADSTTAFGADGQPLRERLVMYNGRLYGWTGRKLFEMDIFDSVVGNGTSVTALVKNANPGYRKVYDTGTNEMVDGNYGGSSITSWWADMVTSETAVYFMVGSRGQTRIYEFKAGIAKPIWFPPIGFTCKSLAVQNGVLFAFGHWAGETSTTHKGGAGWALPLATRQPVHLAWFRQEVAQSLHMQEACPSYGSTVMAAAANTGRIFIYDMETDGVTQLDKLPWTYAGGQAASGASYPNSQAKVGSIITYGEYRIASIFYPRSSDSPVKYETYTWEGDQPGNRDVGDTNNAAIATLFMPRFDFNMPYDTKMLYGFHIGYTYEGNTTSGLISGQTIDISYALDDGSYVALTQVTSATTPSSGVKGKHFIAVSTASGSTAKFYKMHYKITVTGTGVGVQAPIVEDVTVEARSLDHDRTWRLILRIKDDQNDQRIRSDRRFAKEARAYLRLLKTNKNVVAFLDYYTLQEQHGASPNDSQTSVDVIVHSIRDVVKRNGEGYTYIVLKAVKT
jgi:hypothetical protein